MAGGDPFTSDLQSFLRDQRRTEGEPPEIPKPVNHQAHLPPAPGMPPGAVPAPGVFPVLRSEEPEVQEPLRVRPREADRNWTVTEPAAERDPSLEQPEPCPNCGSPETLRRQDPEDGPERYYCRPCGFNWITEEGSGDVISIPEPEPEPPMVDSLLLFLNRVVTDYAARGQQGLDLSPGDPGARELSREAARLREELLRVRDLELKRGAGTLMEENAARLLEQARLILSFQEKLQELGKALEEEQRISAELGRKLKEGAENPYHLSAEKARIAELESRLDRLTAAFEAPEDWTLQSLLSVAWCDRMKATVRWVELRGMARCVVMLPARGQSFSAADLIEAVSLAQASLEGKEGEDAS